MEKETEIIVISKAELKILIKECLNEILSQKEKPSELQSKPDEILNIKQVAELLNLSVPTLYGKTANREIPHSKMGKRLYFKRSEIEQWLSQGKVKTNSEIERDANNYITRNPSPYKKSKRWNY